MSSDTFTQDSGAQSYAQHNLRDPQIFGRLFFDSLYRILKVGSIYNVEHNQTRLAVEEFLNFFREAVRQCDDESFAIMIRDELAIVNGETLRLDRLAQKRHNELRDLFTIAKIRGVELFRTMSVDDFISFLVALNDASKSRRGMEGYQLNNITISHGEPIRSIIDAVSNVNHAMYVTHVYVRGLVKVKNMHDQVRERQDANVPMGVVKRILQTISELLSDDDFIILGLLPMRLVAPDPASHSFNTAIYTMLLADRLGLPIKMATEVGMAALYQDLDRLVGIVIGHRDRETVLNVEHQFNSNLRDVAKMLTGLGGDVVSTLRVLMTYERGCAFEDRISKPFYRAPRPLHLVTRIIDICRTYDLLIQGLEGYKARRPDLAIQYLESRSGEAFDEDIVKLFISTMGIYPIGTTVELTSGERGLVIRTPAPSSDPRRPVVKIQSGGRNVVMDLSDPRYSNIEIARALQNDGEDFASTRAFLLT